MINRRRLAVLGLSAVLLTGAARTNRTFKLSSPDGKINVDISLGQKVTYAVSFEGVQVLAPSPISLTINDEVFLGRAPVVERTEVRSVNETIIPAIKTKRAVIPDRFNELEIFFRGNFRIIFRSYNDGTAYRFRTGYRADIKINDEEVAFVFPDQYSAWMSVLGDGLHPAPFKKLPIGELGTERTASVPVVVEIPGGPRVAVMESDVEGYPELYLSGDATGKPVLKGIFNPVAGKEKGREGMSSRTSGIVPSTPGGRTYPWRILGISKSDAGLLENDLAYRLGGTEKIKDSSWVVPGKAVWNGPASGALYGVPFKSGINDATLKHYIDFASRSGFTYFLIDEDRIFNQGGLTARPEIRFNEVLSHASKNRIGIILECPAKILEESMEKTFDQFALWGVKGVKIDLEDRSDLKTASFCRKLAESAAKRKIVLLFEGYRLSAGLLRSHPNILTGESFLNRVVAASEMKTAFSNELCLPFVWMLSGPLNTVPGAMTNFGLTTARESGPRWDVRPGTRCRQMAMGIVYESPLLVLGDSPSNYMKDPDCLAFLSLLPTVWDETKGVDGRIAEYLAVARKNREDWYLGALNDGNPRKLELNLDFLGEGIYKAEIWFDGINADVFPFDLFREARTVSRNDKLIVDMIPGGGWVARLTRTKTP